MSIEKNLERIADALEALVTLGGQRTVTVGEVSVSAPAAAETAETPATSGKGKGGAKSGGKGRSAKATPPPAEESEAPAAEASEPVTREQVREAMRVFLKTHEKAEAKAALEKLGAPSITALPEEKLAEALKALS